MREIYPKGSEWRRWDLQVQTILDDGYIELKAYANDLKKSHPTEWASFIASVGSEENALKFDSKDYFYTDCTSDEKTRAENYAKTFVSFLEHFQKGEVCLAITDHNYDHLYLLDELINAAKKSKTVNIIGGVEINIQGVHILALFGDIIYGKNSFSDGISTFLTKIEIDNKQSNGVLTVSNKSYTEVLSKIKNNNGIVIYPHCNSSNGLFQEKGKTDRTHLADQFNFQEFNILQGKNKTGGEKVVNYIKSRAKDLKSGYCYTTATDARCLNHILSSDDDGNYTWIKSDPTFEGLKQIMYESSRVAIQANQPEDKAGYQVIDKIEINNELILNTEIPLNANMNSIIGGRSTGKSVLLTAIAQKLKTEEPISFPHKTEYEIFVKQISSSITVKWKDGEINDKREIEFFQQGYMYDLATNDTKLSKLVQDILRIKGKDGFLKSYSVKKSELKKLLSAHINDLFQMLIDIQQRSVSLTEKGDRKGVEDEIEKLENKLKELDVLQLIDSERKNYEHHKQLIESLTKVCDQLVKDVTQLKNLRELSLVKQDLNYELASISDFSRNKVSELFDNLKTEINKKWIDGLDQYIIQLNGSIDTEEKRIIQSKMNTDYIKASQAYKSSTQLNEIQDRIKEQKKKLSDIEIVSIEISELEKQKNLIKDKIIESHNEYYSITVELLQNLSDSQDGLDIKAYWQFNIEKYRSILEGALNQKSIPNRKVAEFEYINNDLYRTEVLGLLNSLISNSLTYKGGYTSQSLATAILTECFYGVSYDLIYEGDNFKQMSDGKKAFVVLKLLLDFSDKKCPILIDQPEDDLDNRAIYLDLVQYLKKKKVQRQIIVATHNPNIVVGADSELAIVANQHGVKNENTDSKKFAYKSGSLENSAPLNFSNPIVLDSQGIREHVCVILEGGDAAFKLREKKYGIGV